MKTRLGCRREDWKVEGLAPAAFWPEALPWAQLVHATLPELYISFILSQWGDETGFGGYDWSVANNPGNVGSYDGKPINKFPTRQEGVQAYINCITNGYYGGVLAAKSPEAQCYAMGSSPWASGHYDGSGPPPGRDLVEIMTANNLTQYDEAPAPAPTPAPSWAIIKPVSGKYGALNAPVVAVVGTPTGLGYIEVASDGGTFNYGDAPYLGSLASIKLAKPIIDAAITPSGQGLTLVATDGGVFDLGDSEFEGSAGNLQLAAPVVSIATTPSGKGYWLTGADGGVFAFGDAPFKGAA